MNKTIKTLLIIMSAPTLVFVVFLWAFFLLDYQSSQPEKSIKSQNIQNSLSPEQVKILDEQIELCLSTGAIYSINIERAEVRIDPLVWSQLDVEKKRGLVRLYGKYCAAKTGDFLLERMIKIKSSRSDEVFAGYSWDEVKIYK